MLALRKNKMYKLEKVVYTFLRRLHIQKASLTLLAFYVALIFVAFVLFQLGESIFHPY